MTETDPQPDLYSPGRRLTQLAGERPDETALREIASDGTERALTWAEFESAANRFAHRLADQGVDGGSWVAVGLPNGLEHVVAAHAGWKLGACVMPVSSKLPAAERDRFLQLGAPRVVVADWDDVDGIGGDDVLSSPGDDSPPRDRVPAPWKALGSGGSTGLSKLIVAPGAFAYPAGEHPLAAPTGLYDHDVVLAPGPLYHNQPFSAMALAVFTGATFVTMRKFDAALTLELIERLGVTYASVVPTMMTRMLRVPGQENRDLSSLRVLMHMAAPCPEWAKRAWIDRIGAAHVWELWAATEMVGITIVTGDEWLAHPGTVGRPVNTEILIADQAGTVLPTAEVGEIYTRMPDQAPDQAADSYAYRGADPLRELPGGYRSVGDLGWLDEDGYLHLADRRTDLIITGGANVFPAEVESALSSHPGVADVAVVGLVDEDLGRRVHAIVEPRAGTAPPSGEELHTHCNEQLARYKCPRTIEFVEQLPRAETGKIRRAQLRDERDAAAASR